MKHIDVAIVGGGVVGSATAYYLKKLGYQGRVAIIEKDTTYQFTATARSLGGIRQQFSTPENIALSTFGLALVRNLKAEFGPEADVGFKEQGYLILASQQGLQALEENHATQISCGANNVILKAAALTQQFPWLNTEDVVAGCLGIAGEGWFDPYSMMSILRKAAIARGVEVIVGEVTAVSTQNHRVKSVTLASGENYTCGVLVNAAGAGAGALAEKLPIDLPVNPTKRYTYVLDCPGATEALHLAPLIFDITGFHMRPEGRNFLCGLSPEPHEEPTTMDWEVEYSWFEERIWPALAHRIPHFEVIKVINAWVGFYDYNFFDQNAVIGPHPTISNFLFANGFSGHGIQQGPATGNAIAELIIHGCYKAIDLTRFGYARITENKPLFERNVI